MKVEIVAHQTSIFIPSLSEESPSQKNTSISLFCGHSLSSLVKILHHLRDFFFFWCYFPLGLYPRFQGYSSWRQGRWEVIFSLRDLFKNSISLIIKKDKVFPYSKQVKRGNEHDFATHTCIRKEKHGRQRKIYRWERRNGSVAMLEFIMNR